MGEVGGGGLSPDQVNALVENAMADKDTNGNPVPSWKPRTFAYDPSGNLATETLTDGASTWVKTYTYSNGAQATDSGWVKQ